MNRKSSAAYASRQRAPGVCHVECVGGGSRCVQLRFPYMFGDWGGNRTQLENDGVKFDVNYTMESASNTGGGADTNTSMRYSDQVGVWPES